ncbi:MAG: cytochrome c3 family protein [Desulfobulbaceae bacterium]
MSICRADYEKFQAAVWRLAVIAALLAVPGMSAAQILGLCSNCHTMHNSQDNLAMTLENPWDTPGELHGQLLRASCLGCHAQGAGATNIVASGGNRFPQVFHDDPSGDLAGGNFWYISTSTDAKGHNILALTGEDMTLYYPPGFIISGPPEQNHAANIRTDRLSCAGDPGIENLGGCHGNRTHRGPGDYTLGGIKGAHHDNVSGTVDPTPDENRPGHGFRFLVGVKGYEDPDWQATRSPGDHNEYFALAAPVQLGCGGGLTSCHSGPNNDVRPPDGTISQYCATCHGNFHTLGTASDSGIGVDEIAPFIRHPTDLTIPSRDEYLDYTVYDLDSPVARTSVGGLSGPSSVVSPGADAVMCLSCHYSHAGPYDDMLRWDYTTMVAGGGTTSPSGCFACHTTKD